MSASDRHSPMGDRRIRVRVFATEAEARSAIRNSYAPNYAAKAVQSRKEVTGEVPFNPEPEITNMATAANSGLPSDVSLTTVTADQVYAMPNTGDLVDLHVQGKFVPRVNRVMRRCLFESTDTPGTISAGKVATVTAANYGIDLIPYGVSLDLYDSEIRHASKLINVGKSLKLESCHLYDCGEDAVHAGWHDGLIDIIGTYIEKANNLQFHHKVGYTHAQTHSDLIQVRGQSASSILRVRDGSHLNGASPGQVGGPIGAQYGTVNRAILAQSGSGEIFNVQILDAWLACGGNYVVELRDKNYGPVQYWVINDSVFRTGYQSAGVLHSGGNASASGNTMEGSGANVDALILNGGSWE